MARSSTVERWVFGDRCRGHRVAGRKLGFSRVATQNIRPGAGRRGRLRAPLDAGRPAGAKRGQLLAVPSVQKPGRSAYRVPRANDVPLLRVRLTHDEPDGINTIQSRMSQVHVSRIIEGVQ